MAESPGAEDSPEAILRKKTLPLLRAVLTAKAKEGVPLHLLCHEFQETCMEPLNFKKMGYGSLEQYVRDNPAICSISPAPEGFLLVRGIASEEDAHIYKLVKGQKKSKKSKPKKLNFSTINIKRKSSFFNSANSNYKGKSTSYYKPKTYDKRPTNYMDSFNSRPSGILGSRPFFQNSTITTSNQKNSFTNPSKNNNFMKPSKVRDIPTRQSSIISKQPGLAPRFQRQQQQQQKNNYKFDKNNAQQNKHPVIDLTNDDDDLRSMLTKNGPPSSTPTKKLNISAPELTSLESRLRDLLIKRPNGLWLTRLKPEFKTMYDEEISSDIGDVIKQRFTHFINVESPVPGREILFLKKENLPHPDVTPINTTLSNLPIASTTNGTTQKQIQHNTNSVTSPTPVSPPTTPTSPDYKIGSMDLPEPGDAVDVYICYVETVNRFYVQLANSVIEDLVEDMQLHYAEDSSTFGKPRLGQYCAARSSEDKKWFRATILTVKEQVNVINNSYRCHVLYVDYGNDEYVVHTELKHLNTDFTHLPCQAIRCSLADVTPNTESGQWSEECVEFFITATLDLKLKMVIKDKNTSVLSVDLYDERGNSICSALREKGFARPLKIPSPPSSTSSRSSTASTESEKASIGSFSGAAENVIPRWVDIPLEDIYCDVSVSNIVSTNNISIILIGEEYHEKLELLEKCMAKHFDSETIPLTQKVEIGKFYAVRTKGSWYRAQVKTATLEGEYRVVLVDHGGRSMVTEIKDMPAKFFALPFQAISCSLHQVPESFDPEILQYLTESTLDEARIALIVDRPTEGSDKFNIEIYDTSKEGEANFNLNADLTKRIECEKDLEPKLPEVGGQCRGYITHITDEGDFYIQILSPGLDRLEILMSDITTHFSQKTRACEIVSRPVAGKICCAKFDVDGTWYRAQVKNVMQAARKVEVEFIDYGNSAVINNLQIRKPDAVSEKVLSLPFQALKCKVIGFSQDDFDTSAIERMKVFVEEELDQVVFETIALSFGDHLPVVKIHVPGTPEDYESMADLYERYSTIVSNESSGLSTLKGDTTGENCGVNDTTFENISVQLSPSKETNLRSVRQKFSSEWDVIQRDTSPDHTPSGAGGIPQLKFDSNILEAVILDATNPHKFHALPTSYWEKMESLYKAMSRFYQSDNTPVDNYSVGSVCAVYRIEEKLWYRALITAVVEDKYVVKFPDFHSNIELVSADVMRLLADKFKTMPYLAVSCSLQDVDPLQSSWDTTTCKTFSQLVLQETFQVQIVSRQPDSTYSVRLHGYNESGKMFSVSDELVKQGLAVKKF